MNSVIVKGDKVTIRTIKESDIKTLWNLIFKEENPEWKNGTHRIFRFRCKNTQPIRKRCKLV